MTRSAFIIGDPVSHSKSPLLHGHWLAELGIEGRYEPISVKPDELPGFFERLRGGAYLGGNVTVPHKEAALALCDEVDPAAAAIGAVNTLVVRDGRVLGSNTDVIGFLAALDAGAPGWNDRLARAVVLGAGGGARAVVAGLKARGAGEVAVVNRSPERARALAGSFGAGVAAYGFDDLASLAPEATLLVNTTTVGMHGTRFDSLPLAAFPAGAVVTDIVYTPLVTPLLAEAKERGLHIVDGLGMLLHQAVPGFAAWFGQRPEVTPALREKIERAVSG